MVRRVPVVVSHVVVVRRAGVAVRRAAVERRDKARVRERAGYVPHAHRLAGRHGARVDVERIEEKTERL